MTPLHIQIMLHYYSSMAEPYAVNDPAHRHSSAVKEYHMQLLDMAMLEPSEFSTVYKVTEKGRAYVEALKAVKEPVQKITWVQP